MAIAFAAGLFPQAPLRAQSGADLTQILERLSKLEKANRELTEEVRTLRRELASNASRSASPDVTAGQQNNWTAGDEERAPAISPVTVANGPTLEEQVAIHGSRIDEQAQTKVESGARFPIRLKGMVLMNAFLNSKQAGNEEMPAYAAATGEGTGGASFRQTMIGLDFQGPTVFGGGKLRGNVMMDFYGGSGQSLDQALRLRTGYVQVDWKSRSLTVGLDKPILSSREPTSLASIATSPLAGAGNLWMWTPQIRLEQSIHFSEATTLKAQAALVQTQESSIYEGGKSGVEIEAARPGFQSRLQFGHEFGNGRRFEFGPGLHVSTSHIEHVPVPSRVYSADWLVSPWRKIELTGSIYRGQNVAHLGTGGTGTGFVFVGPGIVRPVRSLGAWSQVALLATDRLSFHLFGGQQRDRNLDLIDGMINRNLVYGGNIFYRLSSNFIVALETTQARTSYINTGLRLNNHYDLAFAYIF